MKKARVLIAAGGTGGHLWPALSLARAIRKREPGTEFLFVGAGKPMEEKILGPENWNRLVLKSSGLKGRGVLEKIRALAECAAGVLGAIKILRDFAPSVVVGVGGYVTVPVGLAARISGIPLILHEQNSRPGLANRVLAKMAEAVMLGFPLAASSFKGIRTVLTGNPLRPEIEALSDLPRDFSGETARILVTGGSQGAVAVNSLASKALARLREHGVKFCVTHQTGEADCENIREFYKAEGVENRTEAFFQDMAGLYAKADLLIGRAGAATVSELAASALPSILVPLPTAADDHQTVNAGCLAGCGAALLMPQKAASPEILAETLAGLLNDKNELQKMSAAAKGAAILGADALMAEIVLGAMAGKYQVKHA